MIEISRLHCPSAPGGTGDNTTHHLVMKAAGIICVYCGRSERDLRDAVPTSDLWEREQSRSEEFDAWGEIAEPRASHARMMIVKGASERYPRWDTAYTAHADKLLRAWFDAEQKVRDTFADTKAEVAAMRRALLKFEMLCNYLDATGLAGTHRDPRGGEE
jgi:hypothetical protein